MLSYEKEQASPLRRRVPAREGSGGDRVWAKVGAVAGLLGLQRSIGNAAVAQLLEAGEESESPVRSVIGRGGGRALDAGVRKEMERFGEDFSAVRLHSGAAAAESARSVGARAYTVGNEIVLGPGAPSLGTPTGQRTLAHELTHVVQQRSGPVDGSPAPGGIRLSDPSDRFERQAEATAERLMGGGGAGAGELSGAAAGAAELGAAELGVQRQEEEEEEGSE